jgi:hypothetical protein
MTFYLARDFKAAGLRLTREAVGAGFTACPTFQQLQTVE